MVVNVNKEQEVIEQQGAVQFDDKIYPFVFPEIKDWPIYRLHEDRKNFVQELERYIFERLTSQRGVQIYDLIAQTIYLEKIRMKDDPWKVDPPNERAYWKRLEKRLAKNAINGEEEAVKAEQQEILQKIIHRYSEEVVGTFNIQAFLFARKFLTLTLNRLLNTAGNRNFRRLYSARLRLHERFKLSGPLEQIRNLAKKGTIVIVPTHSSNLDSVVIAWAMDQMMGLPCFSFGAGLNLYNSGVIAYFLNRIGTYRVDRRKKNPIYLDTLKGMSKLAIQRGTNSLFYPLGTRSRSGELENYFKKGLLGTVVEAQRSLCQKNAKNKVFIIPLVLSYHTVLEAPFLIEQHLKKTGKERYHKTNRDQSYSVRKISNFLWNFFSRESDIVLSFGKPLDVLGNFVDDNGTSYDRRQNEVKIEDYFKSNQKITKDLQREREYTKVLATRIIDRYHKENIVLSSHLIAFAAFNLLLNKNPKLDLYSTLRQPEEEYVFAIEELINLVEIIRTNLFEKNNEGKIKLSEQIFWDVDRLIEDGVKNLGSYHTRKPLYYTKKTKEIKSENFQVLFYYHNRLRTYGLDQEIAEVHNLDQYF
ncbi:MAG: 1-acyl-sn-glycerol-3-phosphate acyltransferase [Bacteroidota bacterium]